MPTRMENLELYRPAGQQRTFLRAGQHKETEIRGGYYASFPTLCYLRAVCGLRAPLNGTSSDPINAACINPHQQSHVHTFLSVDRSGYRSTSVNGIVIDATQLPCNCSRPDTCAAPAQVGINKPTPVQFVDSPSCAHWRSCLNCHEVTTLTLDTNRVATKQILRLLKVLCNCKNFRQRLWLKG